MLNVSKKWWCACVRVCVHVCMRACVCACVRAVTYEAGLGSITLQYNRLLLLLLSFFSITITC